MKTFRNLIPALLLFSIVLTALHQTSVSAQGTTNLSVLFANGTNVSLSEYSVGSTFAVDLYLADVMDLFGYDITLKYDTSVLTATAINIGDFLLPYYIEWKKVIDNDAGSIWYAASQKTYESGLDGSGILVTIEFTVLSSAQTMLLLSNTKVSDSFGSPIIHTEYNGLLNNPPAEIAVSLDTGYVENHRYRWLKDADKLVTFTAQIKNMGTGTTFARVRFSVLDAEGFPTWERLSDDIPVTQDFQAMRVSADLSPSQLANTALYDIVFALEYVDGSGVWTTGHKGSPTGNRLMMIKSFTVEELP